MSPEEQARAALQTENARLIALLAQADGNIG